MAKKERAKEIFSKVKELGLQLADVNGINLAHLCTKIDGKLGVDDPDEKDSYQFSLSRDNKPDFSLDGSNLLSKRPFDFEEKNSYSVSIQVSDSEKESMVGTLEISIDDVNEAPVLVSKVNMKVKHAEDAGKIVTRIKAQDLDAGQDNIKYKLEKGEDGRAFKITSRGDLAFLKLPDFENPLDLSLIHI